MGYFTDSFDIGAGATLGALTAVNAAQLTDKLTDYAANSAYTKYRKENFDDAVFSDLDNLLVYGSLPEAPYPFPRGLKAKRFDWQRIVILVGLVASFAVIVYGVSTLNQGLSETATAYMAIFITWGIIHLIVKLVKKGAEFTGDKMFRERLNKDGSQYWLIREHVRQELAAHNMSLKEAFRRLSSSNLGQQFPYTLDYIEAHAYQYKIAHQN